MGSSNSKPKPDFVPFRLDIDIPNANDTSWRSYWFSCSIEQRSKPRSEFERLFKQRVVKWRGFVYKTELRESKPRIFVKMNPTDAEGPDIMIQFPRGVDTGDPATYARWAPISFVVAIDDYKEKDGYLRTHAVTEQPSPASPTWEYFLRVYGSQARMISKSIFMMYFRGRQVSWIGRISRTKKKQWFLRMDPPERASGKSDVQINIPDGILVPEKFKRGWWCRVNGVVVEMASKNVPTQVVASQLAAAKDPGQLAGQPGAARPVYETAHLQENAHTAPSQQHDPYRSHYATSPVGVDNEAEPSAPSEVSDHSSPGRVNGPARNISHDEAVGDAVADAVRSIRTALRPVVDMVTVQLRNASVSVAMGAADAARSSSSSGKASTPLGAGRPLPAIPGSAGKRALPPPPVRRQTVAASDGYHEPTVTVGPLLDHQDVAGYPTRDDFMVETPKALDMYPAVAPEVGWSRAFEQRQMDDTTVYSDSEATKPRARKQSVNIYPGEFDTDEQHIMHSSGEGFSPTDRLADIEANIAMRKRQRISAPISASSSASGTPSKTQRASAAVKAPLPIHETPAATPSAMVEEASASREQIELDKAVNEARDRAEEEVRDMERDARDMAKRQAAMKVYMARLADERRAEAERRRRAEVDVIQLEQPLEENDEAAEIAATVEAEIQRSMAGHAQLPRRQLNEDYSPEVAQEATSELARIEAVQRARRARLASLRLYPAEQRVDSEEEESEEESESETNAAVLVAG